MSHIVHVTDRCKTCFQEVTVEWNRVALMQWQTGHYNIQEVAPSMPVDDREFMLSGICGTCFDAMWEDEDDE